MPERYPPIEPYRSGMLDVGDGQRIYWEVCGSPNSKLALYLHSGPGSDSTPGAHRFADSDTYRYR